MSIFSAFRDILKGFFPDKNLTKTPKFLENRDTYLTLLKMGIDKGKAVGAMMLSALAVEPALAEEQRPSVQLAGMTSGQVTDCVAFVKDQRALAADNGIEMSRRDQKGMLLDCRNGNIEARIAEQERILAEFGVKLGQIGLHLDKQGQILDEQGRVLAEITAVNEQLIIRAQEADQRIAVKLQEAEQILRRLATS